MMLGDCRAKAIFVAASIMAQGRLCGDGAARCWPMHCRRSGPCIYRPWGRGLTILPHLLQKRTVKHSCRARRSRSIRMGVKMVLYTSGTTGQAQGRAAQPLHPDARRPAEEHRGTGGLKAGRRNADAIARHPRISGYANGLEAPFICGIRYGADGKLGMPADATDADRAARAMRRHRGGHTLSGGTGGRQRVRRASGCPASASLPAAERQCRTI